MTKKMGVALEKWNDGIMTSGKLVVVSVMKRFVNALSSAVKLRLFWEVGKEPNQ